MPENNFLNEQFKVPDNVRITFGIIVLNGLPFIEYNLRTLYPFAHQIIVVEGAAPSSKRFASEAGHSLDGTLDELYRFQQEEDPENKIIVVTAEDEVMPDGFWPEKDEMSQAYAKRATGNYLWQIDGDEFYLEKDMQSIINMLSNYPSIKAVSFSMRTFWGSPDYLVDGFFLNKFIVHRIFAWGPGYKYLSHRPVTVINENSVDLRTLKWLTHDDMRAKGIYMYHFELIFPKQVIEKCGYYAGAEWTTALQKANEWVNTCYLKIGKPFRVHMMYDHISWLEKYTGSLPKQIALMRKGVNENRYKGIAFRDMTDADKLIDTFSYRLYSMILRWLLPVEKQIHDMKIAFKKTWLGKSMIQFKNQLKGQLTPIKSGDVSKTLLDAWKSSSIPNKQMQLTKHELESMYAGSVIKPYQVLADSLKIINGGNKSIIEIGCSTGYYYEVLTHLLNTKVNYTGVDYSDAMISEAIDKYRGVSFKVADATELPFNNRSFDVVISGCCLLHIPDYSKAISESARISDHWVIFHRTPMAKGPTSYFTKKAYGVPCVEIHFNETSFIEICNNNGLLLRHIFDNDSSLNTEFSNKTYVFERSDVPVLSSHIKK